MQKNNPFFSNLILLSLFVFAVVGFAETITIIDQIGGFTNAQACVGYSDVVYILDHYKVMTYNPITGAFLDTLDLGEYVRDIDFSGNRAVVVGISHVFLIDVSDPSSLSEIDAETFGMGSIGWCADICGDMAYVAAQNVVPIYEISPTGLSIRGNYYPPGSFPIARAVAVRDTTMYVGLDLSGIAAVNVSNPATPTLRMMADTPGYTMDLKIAPDDILVCSDGSYFGRDTASVQFLSIPTSSTIDSIGTWAVTGGDCLESYIVGNRLALADGEGGVRIIDFSDPTAPYQVVHQPTSDNINGVFVSGDTVFAAGTDTFYIMTTDAFVADTDTVIIVEPPVIDSVQPPEGIITACDSIVFTWFFSEGTFPVDPLSAVILANGISYTPFDSEVIVGPGYTGLELATPLFDTGDTVYASLDNLADTAGTLATGLGLSTYLVIDNSPPELSGISPLSGDSVHPDSVVIYGQIADSPAGFDESSFRVIVDGISYSTAGMYLDYTAPDFVCTPMGSFDWGDTVVVCIRAEDSVSTEYCGPNALDTCWVFYIRGSSIPENRFPGDYEFSVYPNPFNASCRVRAVGKVEVFDINGRLVASMKNPIIDDRTPITDFIWRPPANVVSGIYLVRSEETGDIVKAALIR